MPRSRDLRPTVWVERVAVSAMLEEASRAHPMETGGLLIGYRGPDRTAVVTQIIGPGPGAIHRGDSFEPDYNFHEAALERIHAESGGIERYLGDWHTHPDGKLYLSPKDLAVLRQIAEHADAGTKHPLMLVIATGATCTAAVWRYRRRRWRLPVESCELVLE